jgi:hypothetical protein
LVEPKKTLGLESRTVITWGDDYQTDKQEWLVSALHIHPGINVGSHMGGLNIFFREDGSIDMHLPPDKVMAELADDLVDATLCIMPIKASGRTSSRKKAEPKE